jgi:nucleoside-diphosphate-sugar epimerase
MDLVHVEDVCAGILAILDNFEACRIHRSGAIGRGVCSDFPSYDKQILELGSGTEITVNDAVRAIEAKLGLKLRVRRVPMRSGEKEGTSLCADLSRLAALAGYSPKVDLAAGLEDTIAFYRAQIHGSCERASGS